jgi:hypothetical protein
MEGFLILCLAGWVWWQGRRNTALSRRVDALESRVRALAAEREPLILDRPLPPEDEALVLTALPEPEAPPFEPPSARAWGAAAALATLYVWFGFTLASGAVVASLAILCVASLGGVACAALPALSTPLRLGSAQAIAPALTISISSVLLIWVWPLAALTGFALAPALAGGFHIALAAYTLRRRWAHATPFAIAAAALVLGVAGYLRVRVVSAPSDISGYFTALLLATAIAAAALAARPSHRARAPIALAAALSVTLLLSLAALTHAPWGNPWSWAPLFAGAVAALGIAAYAASRTASPEKDLAVLWWSGAGCALALIGAHAVSGPALLPASLALLALGGAYALRRTSWRAFAWAALAAGALALLHALSSQTQTAALGPLGAPWASALAMVVAAGLFHRTMRVLKPRAPASADAFNAASWAMLVIAALALGTHLQR